MRRLSVILDDVTGLFAIQKQQRIHQDFPLISQLESQGREYGICIWAAAHEPQLVLSSAKNVNVRLMMPLSSGADAEEMARNLGLTHAEAVRAKNLVEGEAILKVGSRSFGCLLVELEPSRVSRQLTVDQARQRSEELRKQLLSHVKPRSRKLEAILRVESGTKKKREDADSYLAKVVESTGLMISEIREKYKFTIKKEMSLRRQNVERGYIIVREINVSRRGKNPKIPEVTQKGRERLAGLGRKVSHRGKGGAEHVFWQRRGKEFLEEVLGCQARLEATAGNKTFDVFGTDGDQTVGMEIVMDSSYETTNIRKGMGRVDRLIVACRSKTVMENLRGKVVREMGEEVAGKVEFKLVKDIYLPRKGGDD